MNRILLRQSLICLLYLLSYVTVTAQEKETLAPLAKGSPAPASFEEMWAGFDPRAEPLETETLYEWEEEGVVLRVVRFRIGVFKGRKAKLAAVYGYPKNAGEKGEKLPGLLQIHGGGQYADHKACLANAKRGYATVSISWAGRISSPHYRVSPDIVKLFWDGKVDDPKYKLTTDWGAMDAYHAPSRNKGNGFTTVSAHEWTLDEVESPRNSPWFLCALAARRALTFLEQQPEVDGNKLGVYGHSMGGKLTVMTSSDPRVKACAPSCGGISDRENRSDLFVKTIADNVGLAEIKCPTIFLSPANDFHGRIGDLPQAVEELGTEEWRVTCSPHMNHKDTPPYEVATLLWFDQYLKDAFEFPETPKTKITLDSRRTRIVVKPDPNRHYSEVDVFYTQHGKDEGETRFDRENTMNRFWHHANVKEVGGQLVAEIPNLNPEKPLWIYANVTYPLELPVSGAGYYYGPYTAINYNLSSLLTMVSSADLKAAGIRSSSHSELLIEDFEGVWQKEWYADKPNDWRLSTHKVYDEAYAAPQDAKLAFQVKSKDSNSLTVAVDGYVAEVNVVGNDKWQSVTLNPSDFKNFEDETLESWTGIKTLKFGDAERLRSNKERGRNRVVGKRWNGQKPEFKNLRWEQAN